MHTWIDQVLAPHAATAPQGIVPSLLLDIYHYHMMCSVVDIIEDIGIQVIHIPGGCTGMCQLVKCH